MYMFKYILKRLGLLLMTFVIIEIISFILIKSLPLVINVGIGQDREIIEMQFRARHYYDPIPVQFFYYLKLIFTKGDFGIYCNLPEYRDQSVIEVFK